MLPKYLIEAIKEWDSYTERIIPSAKDELAEIERKVQVGELSEEDAKREKQLTHIGLSFGRRSFDKPSKLRLGAQDLYRSKIRKKANSGLILFQFLLENLDLISPEHKHGKPVIDPIRMDNICLLWLLRRRKKQWALLESRPDNAFYRPPQLEYSGKNEALPPIELKGLTR
jgi:hypothetical protein